ncbi:MAG: asparaginase [Pseudolabrys sp.]|nr:asparaginase [Pseudolabrys sp.]
MGNPVLVEVMRGGRVESRHTGSVAVVDADGRAVLTIGDVELPCYPRSAVKALQALLLVESGAADRFGLGPQELALACASHTGEPDHVATAKRMLRQAGLDADALKCGAQWPRDQKAAQDLARSGGTAGAIHNNCSGKHAGFLCVACALEAERDSYILPDHPVQRLVRATMEQLTGATLSDDRRAVDGCSAPTWAMPLSALAKGFARFGTGVGLEPERAKAAARLREACATHPWYVAGTERFCTRVMSCFGAGIFIKTGAEGVYVAALPSAGLGIAVKCDDGAARAAEVMVAATLQQFIKADALVALARPTLRNWNDMEVGSLRPAGPLSG